MTLFDLRTDFQNYLRTQTGNNTTVNIIISTVDYLLRVQVRASASGPSGRLRVPPGCGLLSGLVRRVAFDLPLTEPPGERPPGLRLSSWLRSPHCVLSACSDRPSRILALMSFSTLFSFGKALTGYAPFAAGR